MTLWIVGKRGQLARALAGRTHQHHISTGRDEINLLDRHEVVAFVDKNKITSIINASAYTNVELAERERAEAFVVNCDIPALLAEVSAERQIPLTHFSTDYVFDGKKKEPYTEVDLPAPLNVYGESKLAGERLVLESPFSLVIRTSWLMGLGGHNFIETLFKKKDIRVVNDQIGRVTFCADLAEATFQLQGRFGLVHFANEGILSWYELAKALPLCCDVLPISSAAYPQAAKRPGYSALSLDKVTSWLKKSPRPFKDALNDYLSLRGA